MKNLAKTILVSILCSGLTLAGYHYFYKEQNIPQTTAITSTDSKQKVVNSTDFTQAAENTIHTVVHVKNVSYRRTSNPIIDFFYGYQTQKPQAQIGTGSGVIISEDGYIVTNNHVIEGASMIEITLNNNKTYPAKLVGTDRSMDIALLKIDTNEKLPFSKFGNSDDIKVGEWVLAVGNPYNLTSTVTAGIISAKARNLSSNDIRSFIQTDAAVNPGNSGGALVNTQGDLIGINTMISSNTGSYVGYSFAVPSNLVKRIVDDLREYGKVQQGILGVQGIELSSEISQELGLSISHGFYINSVLENSGAAEANLRKGDIIVGINGEKLMSFRQLSQEIAKKHPQDFIDIDIFREGKLEQKQVQLIQK